MKRFAFLLILPSVLLGANMTDNDGDGLPDLWEAHWGLSTNIATGIYGPQGDPDNDGLPNVAEYRAGYLDLGGDNVYSNYDWAVFGLSPTNAFSKGTVLNDWHYKAATNHAVSLGWMFTDHDFVDDSWELASGNGGDPALPDSALGDSVTNGGWTAYERCRMATAKISRPTLKTRLWYKGPLASVGTVKLYGYTDLSGLDDCTFDVTNINGEVEAVLSRGQILPSTRWWAAIPNGGTFSPAYPIGYTKVEKCGWDKNVLDIYLQPSSGCWPSWAATVVSPSDYDPPSKRFKMRRDTVDGVSSYQLIVLDFLTFSAKTVTPLVFLALGYPAMDWGLPIVPTGLNRTAVAYTLFEGDENTLTNNLHRATFTNRFGLVQAKAVSISPIDGAYVYSAKPVFSWVNNENYPAFSLEIRKGGPTGTRFCTLRDERVGKIDPKTGNVIFELPYSIKERVLGTGQTFSDNTMYVWRVLHNNAKFTYAGSSEGSWSDWKQFRINVAGADRGQGFYSVMANVFYGGPASVNLSNRVRVEVCDNKSFAEEDVSAYTLSDAQILSMRDLFSGTTNVVFSGLSAGTYYVRAYADSNTNGVRDAWESWGYANMGQNGKAYRFDPLPVTIGEGYPTPTVSIVIQDCDTDADWFPDIYEYNANPFSATFLALMGPSSTWDGESDTRVNPTLKSTGSW